MKPNVAVVPRWESPEKQRLRAEIRKWEFRLRCNMDRRERERTEALLADARGRLLAVK